MLKKVKIPPLQEHQRLAVNKLLKASEDTRTADKDSELEYTKDACALEGVEWIEDFSYKHKPQDPQEHERYKRFGDFKFKTHLEYLETPTHLGYVESLKSCTDELIGVLNISKYLQGFDTSNFGSFEAVLNIRNTKDPFKRVKVAEITGDTPVFVDFYTGFNTWQLYTMRMRVLISE